MWSEDTTLEAEVFLHDDPSRLRRRRAKLSSAAELSPECRVMSLSSLPLICCVAGDRDAQSLAGYHYVAAGCSDALVRYASRTFSVDLEIIGWSDTRLILCYVYVYTVLRSMTN